MTLWKWDTKFLGRVKKYYGDNYYKRPCQGKLKVHWLYYAVLGNYITKHNRKCCKNGSIIQVLLNMGIIKYDGMLTAANGDFWCYYTDNADNCLRAGQTRPQHGFQNVIVPLKQRVMLFS